MPTWYLSIQPINEPHELGALDEDGREQWECNFLVTKRPSLDLQAELVAILEQAGVAVLDQTLFVGQRAVIPAGPGPFTSLRVNGGTAPLGTHNDGAGAYRRPSVQALVRARDGAAAEAQLQAVYAAFTAVRNTYVVPA